MCARSSISVCAGVNASVDVDARLLVESGWLLLMKRCGSLSARRVLVLSLNALG